MGGIIDLLKNSKEEESGSLKPDEIKGDIEFRGVTFAYPSKKTLQVLKNVSFKVGANSKTALVGPSGCGKSTII